MRKQTEKIVKIKYIESIVFNSTSAKIAVKIIGHNLKNINEECEVKKKLLT